MSINKGYLHICITYPWTPAYASCFSHNNQDSEAYGIWTLRAMIKMTICCQTLSHKFSRRWSGMGILCTHIILY